MSGRPAVVPLGGWSAVALGLASVVGLLAFTWPLLAGPGSIIEHNSNSAVLLGGVLLMVMVVVLIAISDGGLDVKAVAVLGVLSAVGATLRPLSAGSAGIEFVFFFIVLGGRVFGPGFGFVLGSVTLFTSAMLTGGIGPWLPFQMLAASWIGMGAGLLPGRMRGRGEVAVLAVFAALCGFGYGQIMNLSFWPFTVGADTALSYVAGAPLAENFGRFLVYSLATSLGWDLMRATVLGVGIALIARPMLATLRRTANRAAFAPEISRASLDEHKM